MEVWSWQERPEWQHWRWGPGRSGAARELGPGSFTFGICWVCRERVEAGAEGLVRLGLGEMSTHSLSSSFGDRAHPGSGPQALDLAAWPGEVPRWGSLARGGR